MYILYGSTISGHASLVSQDSHCKTKLYNLMLWHVNERWLVELSKQGLLGSHK